MSNIDFKRPVETVTGIPVQIISTSGREPYPVVGYVGEPSLALQSWTSEGFWYKGDDESCYNLRNKATWQLPAPPEGQQWHRVDGWTEEMLPAGYRPLLLGEIPTTEDEFWRGGLWQRRRVDFCAVDGDYCHHRTTHPIPQQQQPQEPWATEKAAFAAGETIQYSSDLKPTWTDITDPFWVNPSLSSVNPRYRIKPKPQKVPLEPCDVPPGSVIRGQGEDSGWCMITSASRTGIRIWRHSDENASEITWQTLMDAESQVWRPTDTEWQPCYKATQQ
jgi:hypothetical protein